MAEILLADDDQMLRDLYQLKFSKAGHNIVLAQDAREALARITETKPDVILLDRRLGEDDGLLLLGKIRQMESVKNVPALLLSNQDPTAEDLAEIKKLAPAEYVIKEKIELNDLVRKVSELAKKL